MTSARGRSVLARLIVCSCRREREESHHFAAQFTADLLAMNSTDFIITSSFQVLPQSCHRVTILLADHTQHTAQP